MMTSEHFADISAIVNDPQFQNYFRRPPAIDGPTVCPIIKIGGEEFLMLCNGDYLGLANHPDIIEIVQDGYEKFGLTASGSRWVCGTQSPHLELEKTIAEFQGTEDAIVYFLVTVASQGVIGPMMHFTEKIVGVTSTQVKNPEWTEIHIDGHSHPSLFDAVHLARVSKVYPFRHNDMDTLEAHLKRNRPASSRIMIVTDGLNSAFGDLAPLPVIVELAERYNALVCVDDAHGTGVLGENGRGIWEHFDCADQVDLKIGSLAKAFAGGFGAFVAADTIITDYLRTTGGHYMFGGSIPPAVASGMTALIKMAEKESWRRTKVLENAEYLRNHLNDLGFDTYGSEAQIVPVRIGDETKGLTIFEELLRNHIIAPCFRWPAVAKGDARIRLNPNALHEFYHLDRFLEVFTRAAESVGLPD